MEHVFKKEETVIDSHDKVSDGQDQVNNLRALYDKYVEFEACCSFFCDAFACIAEQEEVIDEGTVRGVGICANWIKTRSSEIKGDLKIIFEQAKIGKKETGKDGENTHRQ